MERPQQLHNDPGRKMIVGKGFRWGEKHFFVPAVYLSAEGLVIDICSPTDPDKITVFMRKYRFLENHHGELPFETEEALNRDNPMNRDFSCSAVLNGEPLRPRSSSCRYYRPGGEQSADCEDWLQKYGLDPDMAWTCIRASCIFEGQPIDTIDTLSIVLSQHPIEKTVGHFDSLPPGSEVEAIDPFTGVTHRITILGEENAELPQEHREDDNFIYPPYYRQLEYYIDPEPADNIFPIRDSDRADSGRSKKGTGSAGAIGLMVRRHKPAPGEKRIYVALSSMHFEEKDSVHWRIVFKGKTTADLTVKLI